MPPTISINHRHHQRQLKLINNTVLNQRRCRHCLLYSCHCQPILANTKKAQHPHTNYNLLSKSELQQIEVDISAVNKAYSGKELPIVRRSSIVNNNNTNTAAANTTTNNNNNTNNCTSSAEPHCQQIKIDTSNIIPGVDLAYQFNSVGLFTELIQNLQRNEQELKSILTVTQKTNKNRTNNNSNSTRSVSNTNKKTVTSATVAESNNHSTENTENSTTANNNSINSNYSKLTDLDTATRLTYSRPVIASVLSNKPIHPTITANIDQSTIQQTLKSILNPPIQSTGAAERDARRKALLNDVYSAVKLNMSIDTSDSFRPS